MHARIERWRDHRREREQGGQRRGQVRQRRRQRHADEAPVGAHHRLNRKLQADVERLVLRRVGRLAVEQADDVARHEEDRVLHLDRRRLSVEHRQLRRLHDVRATVALGRFQEQEHLDIAQKCHAKRQTAISARRDSCNRQKVESTSR